MQKNNEYKIINWSEVSRLLCGDRTRIQSNYNGKKYKRRVERLKKIVDIYILWVNRA